PRRGGGVGGEVGRPAVAAVGPGRRGAVAAGGGADDHDVDARCFRRNGGDLDLAAVAAVGRGRAALAAGTAADRAAHGVEGVAGVARGAVWVRQGARVWEAGVVARV